MIRSVLANTRNIYRTCRLFSCDEKVHRYIPPPVENFVAKKGRTSTSRKIDKDTAELLEKLSLVGIENEKAIEILEEAISFAEEIFQVDTTDVKPLVTVLEEESLRLRDDVIEPDVTRKELISLTQCSIENYFTTPEGNIEYIPEKKQFELPVLEKASVKE